MYKIKDIRNKILGGNCLELLKQIPDESIDCCVTSPPYWGLRSYSTSYQIWGGRSDCKHEWKCLLDKEEKLSKEPTQENSRCIHCNAWYGELGHEMDPDQFVSHLCDIFDEVKRVTKKTGGVYVNLGDGYYTKSGSSFLNDKISSNKQVKDRGLDSTNSLKGLGLMPEKSLVLLPERFVIEMQRRGWVVRNKIIWYKKSVMPSSSKDRFTQDFENIYFFTKNKKYWFEQQFEPLKESTKKRYESGWDGKTTKGVSWTGMSKYMGMDKEKINAIQGRNMRTVWERPISNFREAHFACYSPKLVETPIKASCPEFVCKKCGTPRSKIIESKSMEEKKVESTDSKYESTSQERTVRQGFDSTRVWKNPTRVVKGYTECECGKEHGYSPGIVLDPFGGAASTAIESINQKKDWIMLELNPEYIEIADKRIRDHIEVLKDGPKPKKKVIRTKPKPMQKTLEVIK